MLEAPQPLRITREVLGQHLDRHVAIQPRVPRAEHLAHPPAPMLALIRYWFRDAPIILSL